MTTATAVTEPVQGTVALASVPFDRADVADVASFVDLPGLAARLARMAAEIRLIACNTPVWAMGAAGLGDAIEQAQRVRARAHNQTAVLAAEGDSRGLADQVGLSRNDWVAGQAPGLAGGASTAVTAVGAAMNDPRWSQLSRLVRRGAVTVDKAAVIVRFHDDVQRVADPLHLAAVVDSMVEGAESLGLKELRRLASQARASLRPPAQVEDDDRRMRAGRSLRKIGGCAGMTDYLLRMDPEGAAILDAAIDALARPRPDLDWRDWPSAPGSASASARGSVAVTMWPDAPQACSAEAVGRDAFGLPLGGDELPDADTGSRGFEASFGPSMGSPSGSSSGAAFGTSLGASLGASLGPADDDARASASSSGSARAREVMADPRTPATRRADALLELISRAVGAPQGVTRTPRTKLVVTMSLDALVESVQGAGLADNDEVLSASTVRRLACEAEILPMVLGADSEVLDLGRTERYFTPSQRLALGRRDKGCSFPGCTVPPQWCDAHHVVHWLHGGTTDLPNGALLCGRHHTIVHSLGLTATVTPTSVEWQAPPEHRPPGPGPDPGTHRSRNSASVLTRL